MCACVCVHVQRLLTELVVSKPDDPLDFIIEFLKRDDDGELQERKGSYLIVACNIRAFVTVDFYFY